MAYVRKNGSDFIGWTDVGGRYAEETSGLPVFVIVNSTADRRFLLTNPAGYSLAYNGVVMAAEKRRSHGWQPFGSYTLSRTSGLQPASGANAAGPQDPERGTFGNLYTPRTVASPEAAPVAIRFTVSARDMIAATASDHLTICGLLDSRVAAATKFSYSSSSSRALMFRRGHCGPGR